MHFIQVILELFLDNLFFVFQLYKAFFNIFLRIFLSQEKRERQKDYRKEKTEKRA